jgi:two-component system, response regulator YesN
MHAEWYDRPCPKSPSIHKFIILSVHDQFEYAQKGLKMGVYDYLLKPVSKELLYKTVDEAIEIIRKEKKQKKDIGNWSITQKVMDLSNFGEDISAFEDEKKYFTALFLLGNLAGDKTWADTTLSNIDMKSSFLNEGIREDDVYSIDLTIDEG